MSLVKGTGECAGTLDLVLQSEIWYRRWSPVCDIGWWGVQIGDNPQVINVLADQCS